jgi:Flp pilus assembly protein TadD
MAYTQAQMFPQAIADFEQVKRLTAGSSESIAALGYVYAATGQRRGAQQAILTLRQRQARKEYVSPLDMAMIYVALGEKDRALPLLEQANQQRAPRTIHLAVDPAFASLRSEQRFQTLLRRMNLQH